MWHWQIHHKHNSIMNYHVHVHVIIHLTVKDVHVHVHAKYVGKTMNTQLHHMCTCTTIFHPKGGTMVL